MRSKTSCFEKTIFKKNLTRFAPVMVLYTLCLLLGMAMLYMAGNDRNVPNFWFASHVAQCIYIMGVVNLFYGPLIAMLLFGDLFQGRMCNALHAMPITRERYFMTNILSGLVFSLIPTAIMAGLSLPLLAGTVVHNAWQIGILWFIAVNLEYVCFFGMAVFSVFCTGNRFAMAAVYGVLNGGAFLLYYIIDTLYTPMLYGVVTPDQWVMLLTPIANMVENEAVEVQSYNELTLLFRGRESEMVANFWVNECYYDLIVYAIVGVVFMVLGLLLYRKRDLESAGDAIAVPWLVPVFQVVCAVAVAAIAPMLLSMFFHSGNSGYAVLLYTVLVCGLVIGWFAGKMFLERSTRVFALRNWKGLGILAAVIAVTMGLTYVDVLGFEDWLPDAEKVSYVNLDCGTCGSVELTEQEDIENIIRLHQMGMEDHLEHMGGYPLAYVQENFEGYSHVTFPEDGFTYGEGGYDTNEPHLYADSIYITYHLENGREVTRHYYVWASLEEGEIIKEYLSRWDAVWADARLGWYDTFDLSQIYRIAVESKYLPGEMATTEVAQELLEVIKADCEAGTMTQSTYYHEGRFKGWDEDKQQETYTRMLYVVIYTGDEERYTAADFQIYPDSENTIQWLKDHDLLNYEIVEGNFGG